MGKRPEFRGEGGKKLNFFWQQFLSGRWRKSIFVIKLFGFPGKDFLGGEGKTIYQW